MIRHCDGLTDLWYADS